MDFEQLEQQINRFIQENRQNIVDDIGLVVAVPSVEGPCESPQAPFGPGPRKALDTTLSIARRLGLDTQDGEGYVGWAALPGGGEDFIATITHVDVVPEGDGWIGHPYQMFEKDGWIVGRGVGDNKGPGILCLYAAKFFMENQIPLRYGLRMLFGCNEESGMQDIKYYNAHYPAPLFCFSPDGGFPLCNGEKGSYQGDFVFASAPENLEDFQGGIASNVIPHKAFCIVKNQAVPPRECPGITVTSLGEGRYRLDAKGVGGHAAHPQGTVNAIGLLVDCLVEQNLCPGAAYLALLQKLHQSSDGSGLGIDSSDDTGVFTPLTCIGGMLYLRQGRLVQNINIRYPISTTGAAITQRLTQLAEDCGGQLTVTRDESPFYISDDHPAIQALLCAYNRVSGEEAKPFTMGGGTYARHFANGVSFGPGEEQRAFPPFAGPEHGPNEGVEVDKLLRALKIYIHAIYGLQQVDF